MQIDQLEKYSLKKFLNKPNSCVDPHTSRKHINKDNKVPMSYNWSHLTWSLYIWMNDKKDSRVVTRYCSVWKCFQADEIHKLKTASETNKEP